MFQQLLSRYTTSSLESEVVKWCRIPAGQRYCKQSRKEQDETIDHSVFECEAFKDIRESFNSFLKDIHNLFKWEYNLMTLSRMHHRRKEPFLVYFSYFS